MTPRPALSSTGAEVHLGAGGLAPGRKRGVEDTGFEAIDEFRAGCMVIQRRLEDAAQGADHRHSYGSPDDAERDQYEATADRTGSQTSSRSCLSIDQLCLNSAMLRSIRPMTVPR